MKPAAWSTDKPTRPVRAPYVRDSWLARHYIVGYLIMALVAGSYGYLFATYGAGGLYMPFVAPLVLIAALLFWVMPEIENPPVRLLDRLFVFFLFALLVWPDYLAISLPGVPWITAVRLVGLPLGITLAIAAFGSPAFRARLLDILSGDRVIVRLLMVFLVICALSIGLSHDKTNSINRFIVALLSWFGIFFAACWYFVTPGRPQRFAWFLYIILLLCLVVGLYEARFNQLPWAGRVPWFLNVQNPIVDALLAGSVRAATGIYRVQSKFSTSIGFGEYMAMVLPFMLHLVVFSRRKVARISIIAVIPVMFYIVLRTDSRLAFIGFCSSILLYTFVAAALRWKQFQQSLIAPAILVAYPVMAGGFALLSLVWRRLYVLIWGGGAQQFSTQSRADQMHMGLPMVFRNPLGHGIGQGAQTLGYIAPGSDRLTIDSYYLSVALEFGVIGFIIYYGMFVWAIWRGGTTAFTTRDPDILYLAPATIAVINFLLSKSIYSQTENHPLAFMLLGMIVALLYRYRTETQGSGARHSIPERQR